MRLFLFSLLVLLFSCSTPPAPAQEDIPVYYDAYPAYRDSSITHRRFKHDDVMAALDRLPSAFRQKQVGASVEGRSIHLVSIGEGNTQVLLWSQMHGDEPTATMALLDLFRFFAASDELDSLRQAILQECTLHFLPLLNPDGAEVFQRRNALGVDLNRDALRLQTPEAQILKRVRDSLDADWGFNLHDQSRYYSAGAGQPYTASISFLAPAFNEAKDISEKREDAMQLIGYMNRVLQHYIPRQVGKYDDTFEPRAFGDNIQKWGTRTILIETGGLEGDREKQELRRLNFVILLRAFAGIASGAYEEVPRTEYQDLPFNRYNAFQDLIVREATYLKGGQNRVLDIAFRRNEIEYDNHSRFYLQGQITDIGDLSTSVAYHEWNAAGMQIVPAKTWPETLPTAETALRLNLWEKVQQGYLYFPVSQQVPNEAYYHDLPVHFLGPNRRPDTDIQIGQNPALLLMSEGQLRYVIVNGRGYDLTEGKTAFEEYFSR